MRDVRLQLAPQLNSYLLSSQYGGFLCRGTDFATHHLRVKTNIAKLTNQSFAILYIDVLSALMSMHRFLVVDRTPSDEEVVRICSSLGLEPCFVDEFCEFVRSASACEAAKVPEDLHRVFSSLLASSGVFSRELTSCASTQRVISSAGSPLADVVLILAIAKVLCLFYSKCHHLGLLDQLDFRSLTPSLVLVAIMKTTQSKVLRILTIL